MWLVEYRILKTTDAKIPRGSYVTTFAYNKINNLKYERKYGIVYHLSL